MPSAIWEICDFRPPPQNRLCGLRRIRMVVVPGLCGLQVAREGTALQMRGGDAPWELESPLCRLHEKAVRSDVAGGAGAVCSGDGGGQPAGNQPGVQPADRWGEQPGAGGPVRGTHHGCVESMTTTLPASFWWRVVAWMVAMEIAIILPSFL